NEARKSRLPAFWLPSLTPESKAGLMSLQDVKLQTICQASEPSHPLLMKHLIPVDFTTISASSSKTSEASSSKSKAEVTLLTNPLRNVVMKPCGHVICKTCTDSLVTPSSQCVKCDAKLGPKDTIELLRE
ncbi:10557_t:CDS:2, partial [Acaulospora colombiana]